VGQAADTAGVEEDSSDDSDGSEYPDYLTDLETFIISSEALKNLRLNLRRFLGIEIVNFDQENMTLFNHLPFSSEEILPEAEDRSDYPCPSKPVWVQQLLDQVKTYLLGTESPIPIGKSRVRWTCVSMIMMWRNNLKLSVRVGMRGRTT
jgi:hypothetical protein